MGMFDKARKAAADTFTEDMVMIDIDNLIESPDNFFELSRIEELAETILGQGGVKENLIVKPINDEEYEVISGHRRVAAVKYLLEKGENISRYLPCLAQDYDSEDEKLLDLVLMNVTARILTDAQMWKCYEIINDILKKKKDLGEKFGQVQKKLAEILGVSTGQAAKMQSIDKNAAPEVKEAVKKGEMSINTAEKISKLGKDEQKKLVSEKSKIKPKDIEKVNNNAATDDDKDQNEEKVTINDNFSKETLVMPIFVKDVITAWDELDLYDEYSVSEDEKWEILELLIDKIKSARKARK
jgi:ParB-like chromosome segregation protein Spo0J